MEMFARAAAHYVANQGKGIETLVVIPLWDEIERFNAQVRPALRDAGLLGETEVVREAVLARHDAEVRGRVTNGFGEGEIGP